MSPRPILVQETNGHRLACQADIFIRRTGGACLERVIGMHEVERAPADDVLD